jgi:hypothetical protein
MLRHILQTIAKVIIEPVRAWAATVGEGGIDASRGRGVARWSVHAAASRRANIDNPHPR